MDTELARPAALAAQAVSAPPAIALKESAPLISFDRSAVLVHALGLAALGLSALVAWILGKAPEALQVQAVGGAAAVMLILWSAVLAYRSLARGQKKRWSLTVMILFVLECGGAGLALPAELADQLLGIWAARRYGASGRGIVGGVIGGILGGLLLNAILPIVGGVIGAFAGAYVGALLVERHTTGDWPAARRAAKAELCALLGG